MTDEEFVKILQELKDKSDSLAQHIQALSSATDASPDDAATVGQLSENAEKIRSVIKLVQDLPSTGKPDTAAS